jgi:hypothetical protein
VIEDSKKSTAPAAADSSMSPQTIATDDFANDQVGFNQVVIFVWMGIPSCVQPTSQTADSMGYYGGAAITEKADAVSTLEQVNSKRRELQKIIVLEARPHAFASIDEVPWLFSLHGHDRYIR